MFFCLAFAMPLCASVLCALWSPAVKGLTSWPSNCDLSVCWAHRGLPVGFLLLRYSV